MKRYFIDNLIHQLNCISRVSALESAQRTQILINKLIGCIRYKTGRENQIVRVKKELKYIGNFMELFKVRFGELLSYDIDVDQSCMDIYIPHYTIMTFVENSMYHAFEEKEGVWEVKIVIKRTGKGLCIEVADNGTGFEPQQYTTQNSQVLEYGTITSTTLRIIEFTKNIDAVRIKSTKQGTSVVISISDFNEETKRNA